MAVVKRLVSTVKLEFASLPKVITVYTDLRKHFRNDHSDYDEDEDTMSDVDVYGDQTDMISSIKLTN